jgi:multisubunit Na+/H+ antiporter MnhB subunit
MKKLFQSKTVLFAVLFFAVSVAGLFGYADYTPGSDLTEIVNIAVSVVMLVLRLVTSKGIEL